jgi:hypothetical protein
MFANLKTKLGFAPPPQPTLPQQLVSSALESLDASTPTLSWKQRAIGFGICFGVGLLLSILVRS